MAPKSCSAQACKRGFGTLLIWMGSVASVGAVAGCEQKAEEAAEPAAVEQPAAEAQEPELTPEQQINQEVEALVAVIEMPDDYVFAVESEISETNLEEQVAKLEAELEAETSAQSDAASKPAATAPATAPERP